ncbi:MAG TPA: SUF system NifU family Fe-S cluster assembly protein [Usitatibacter sp.]|nr:SUF system NifU family Fe-S cluster assembly protein [Usitatibacter sp.]
MNELRELYQQVIFDHYKRPRNCHALDHASHEAEGHNPLCGDNVKIYLEIEDGVIRDVAFEGGGCAIATASASLMTEALKGRRVAEVEHLFDEFHDMVTGAEAPADGGLGKLEVLAGVREFPARVKCATLAWHTARAALHQRHGRISTE